MFLAVLPLQPPIKMLKKMTRRTDRQVLPMMNPFGTFKQKRPAAGDATGPKF
jgi:hypothetical protein